MSTTHRHAEITPNDHGPLVNVASWILLCMSILFTSFRLISNIALRGTTGKDDWIITVATLLAGAQSIASSSMVANGLGQHQSALSEATISAYQKALLASSVLYVAALASTRFTLLFFLGRLLAAPQKAFRLLMKLTWAIVLLYLVVEILVLSFACRLPATWNYLHGSCIDLPSFWDFDTAFDILTSALILALPVVIVWPLQMGPGRKLQAIAAFIFQLPPCVFALIRLVYLHRALDAKDDYTWHAVNWQIWTQINLHFSIVAANMPCLKIFLEGFQSVLFRQNMSTSHGGQTELQSYPRGSNTRKNDGGQRASRRSVFRLDDDESSTAIKTVPNGEPFGASPNRSAEIGEGETAGFHSEEADDSRIYKTTEWTVLETNERPKHHPGAVFR